MTTFIPGVHPSYKTQYDKIIQAYFRDEIKPWQSSFCFCGTLCDNSSAWFGSCRRAHKNYMQYFGKDFLKMEVALLNTMYAANCFAVSVDDEKYESAIFAGMCAALEVLKQIHIEKGEIIDEDIPLFEKRELVKIVL